MGNDVSYFDIVIIGGGLVGASLALALQKTHSSIAIIETQADRPIATDDANGRFIALSHASKKIFTQLEIWPALQAVLYPIKTIHISDKGHFGITRIRAEEQQVDALGFSIQAQQLARVLYESLGANVTWLRPATVMAVNEIAQTLDILLDSIPQTIQAGWIIIADGANSSTRELLGIAHTVTDYQQSAVVANVTVEKSHHDTAFERFTTTGPIALLPIGEKKMALVWTTTLEEVKQLQQIDESIFLQKLHAVFGNRLGQFTHVTQRVCYPLQLTVSQEQTRAGIIILGNAAHALHPVAAQGFNLALRDVMALAELLQTESDRQALLTTYQQQRHYDQQQTIQFTNDLLAIFSNQVWPITPLRGFALSTLDNIPFLKRFIAKRAMGFRQPVIRYDH